MKVLVVQHIVTMAEATRVMRFFKKKKHAKFGYFFEMTDLGMNMQDATSRPKLLAGLGVHVYGKKYLRDANGGMYARPVTAKWGAEDAYILKVYREV